MEPRPLFVLLLVLTFVHASESFGQAPAPERVKREAASQAAEADRLFKQGDYAAALPLYRAEQKSRAELGDLRYEAYAHRGIACCLGRLGAEADAIPALKAALEIDLKLEDTGLAGYDALLLSRTYLRMGEDRQAIEQARFALKRFSKAEDKDHEAEARMQMGLALTRLGRFKEAEVELDQALAIGRPLKLPLLGAETQVARGELLRQTGRANQALEAWLEAESLFGDSVLSSHEVARLGAQIGELLGDLGKFEAAEARLSAAVKKLDAIPDKFASADATLALAGVRLALRKPKPALESVRLARRQFESLGAGSGEIDSMVLEANVLDDLKRRPEAYEILKLAIARAGRVYSEQPEEPVRLQLLAAELAHRLGKADAARDHREKARKLVELIDEEELREPLRQQIDRSAKSP